MHIWLGERNRTLVVASDGAEYLQMARNLLLTGEFTYDGDHPVVGKPPGFPAIVAAYLSIVGSVDGFQYVQLLLLFGAYGLTALLAEQIIGPLWGLALLATLVVIDPLRELTYGLFAEPLFMLFTVAGVYALLRALRSGRVLWPIAAGILFGASTYVRPVNLFWPLVVIVGIYITRRKRLRTGLIVLLLHAAVVAPWLVRNSFAAGRCTPMVANWGPLYIVTDEPLYRIHRREGVVGVSQTEEFQRLIVDEFQFNPVPSERLRRAAMSNIRNDPAGYIGRCLGQAAFAWTYIPGTRGHLSSAPALFALGRIMMGLLGLLVLFGVRAAWRSRDHRTATVMLIGYALYTGVILLPVITEARYLLTPYLLLAVLAMTGIRSLIRRPDRGTRAGDQGALIEKQQAREAE
jgi:hypothetical protein